MEKTRTREIMKRFYYCIKNYDEWTQEKNEYGQCFKHQFFLIESKYNLNFPAECAEQYELFYLNSETKEKEYLDNQPKGATARRWIRKVKKLQKVLDRKQVEKETGMTF